MTRWFFACAGLGLLMAAGLAGCDEAPVAPLYDNPFDPDVPGGPRTLDPPPAPRLQQATATTATLVWGDESEVEDAYLLERAYGDDVLNYADRPDRLNAFFAPIALLPANTTRFTDTTLLGHKPYIYRLKMVSGTRVSEGGPWTRLTWPGIVPVYQRSVYTNCIESSPVGLSVSYGLPTRFRYDTGQTLGAMSADRGVFSLNASRTRLLVAPPYADLNGYVYAIWDVASGHQLAQIDFGSPMPGAVLAPSGVPLGFFVGENEAIVYAGRDPNLPYVLWRPPAADVLPAPALPTISHAASATGTVFAVQNQHLEAYDVHTGALRWTAPTTVFALSPSGRYVALYQPRSIRVVDSGTGAVQGEIPASLPVALGSSTVAPVIVLRMSEDQPYALVGQSGFPDVLHLYDWRAKRILRTLVRLATLDAGCAFTPDGKLALNVGSVYSLLDPEVAWRVE